MESILFKDGKEVGFQHIIRYDGGITSDQVIASASVPLNYGYTTLEVESYNKDTSKYEKNIRYFWDGGIMSNTPLTCGCSTTPALLAQKKGVQTYSSKIKYTQ